MQKFYGIAICQNLDNLYKMKKAVGAIIWHCTDFEDSEYRHHFCPPGQLSWCKYNQDKETGKTTYKKTINIPTWIHDIIKSIFVSLSDDALLSKCLHGETQNPNKALNNIIWTRCPKSIYVNRPVMEMGVNAAVLHYNDSAHGVDDVLAYFSVKSGVFMEHGSMRKNVKSINKMNIKSSVASREKKKEKDTGSQKRVSR